MVPRSICCLVTDRGLRHPGTFQRVTCIHILPYPVECCTNNANRHCAQIKTQT